MALEQVIADWLGGRPVAFTKVDAQGLDVAVVRSAGALMTNLKAVQLEVLSTAGETVHLMISSAPWYEHLGE